MLKYQYMIDKLEKLKKEIDDLTHELITVEGVQFPIDGDLRNIDEIAARLIALHRDINTIVKELRKYH